MSYLYKPRHKPEQSDPAPGRRRIPLVAASAAVLAVAAGLGVAGLEHASSTSTTPAASTVQAADAQALAGEPSTGSPGAHDTPAAPQQQRDAAPATTKAAPAPTSTSASTHSAAPTHTASPTPTIPVQKDLTYQFAWQENYYFCGPAATRIALTAKGLSPSQSEVAQSLGTTVNGTNSSDDTTRALNAYLKTDFYKAHFITGQAATQADIAELKAAVVNAVSQGYAVVANIAGTTTDDAGHSHSYDGGHYLTIVGYRDSGQTVKIADPADAQGVGSYTVSIANMANWIAQRGYSA
ncbi:C39 family peptidase [Dactylosporangium salmoneum]|uniref:Peptidase C39-like domain-containing protein n=1 Tax=Dactylosporangium salmoneum TaxID=53361 RepID=A0ABP5V539_9ACTN